MSNISSSGGRGSWTLVLPTSYRNFLRASGDDQIVTESPPSSLLSNWKIHVFVPWPFCSFVGHWRGAYLCSFAHFSTGSHIDNLCVYCFTISRHGCLHDSLPPIDNQNQNTPKLKMPCAWQGIASTAVNQNQYFMNFTCLSLYYSEKQHQKIKICT